MHRDRFCKKFKVKKNQLTFSGASIFCSSCACVSPSDPFLFLPCRLSLSSSGMLQVSFSPMFSVLFLSCVFATTLFGFLLFLLCEDGAMGTANSCFFSGEFDWQLSLSSLETECSSVELSFSVICFCKDDDSCLELVFLSTVVFGEESLDLLSDWVLLDASPKINVKSFNLDYYIV